MDLVGAIQQLVVGLAYGREQGRVEWGVCGVGWFRCTVSAIVMFIIVIFVIIAIIAITTCFDNETRCIKLTHDITLFDNLFLSHNSLVQ